MAASGKRSALHPRVDGGNPRGLVAVTLSAKAIWRWQNAVILRCWHAWRERTRGRAALNGLLELQPPVLDAAVPARSRPPAKAGRRRSVTNPLLDAKRDEAAYQI